MDFFKFLRKKKEKHFRKKKTLYKTLDMSKFENIHFTRFKRDLNLFMKLIEDKAELIAKNENIDVSNIFSEEVNAYILKKNKKIYLFFIFENIEDEFNYLMKKFSDSSLKKEKTMRIYREKDLSKLTDIFVGDRAKIYNKDVWNTIKMFNEL